MHITRQKRPDRVIEFGEYRVRLIGNNSYIWDGESVVTFPLSEISNLIKALLEIQKETK